MQIFRPFHDELALTCGGEGEVDGHCPQSLVLSAPRGISHQEKKVSFGAATDASCSDN